MSDGSAQIRILTVDDHALVREGIAVLVGTQPDMTLVAEASNGREAIQQFRAHRPDITLMDLQMPEMNGLDAMVAIRGEFPECKDRRADDLQGRRSDSSCNESRRQRLPPKNHDAQRTRRNDPSGSCRKKGAFSEASYEVAEHATDDTLTPAEISCVATDRSRQRKQANRGSALHHRGNRQESSQVHPFQVGRERSKAHRDDRVKRGIIGL